MQDSVYYKKNTYKKLLLSVVKFLFFSAVTYLFSMMNLYENDISVCVAFAVSMSYYDRKYIPLGFFIVLGAVINEDVIFIFMASVAVVLMMILLGIYKNAGMLSMSLMSAAVCFFPALAAYMTFSLSDGYMLTAAISSAISFIAASVFGQTLNVLKFRRSFSRLTSGETVSVLLSLSLAVISLDGIKTMGVSLAVVIMISVIMYSGKYYPDKCMPFAFCGSVLSVVFLGSDLSVVNVMLSLGFISCLSGTMKSSMQFVFCSVGFLILCGLLGLSAGGYIWELILSFPVMKVFVFLGEKYGVFGDGEVRKKEHSISESMDIILTNEISRNKAALRCICDNVNYDEGESDIYRDICRIAITEVCMQCANYPSCWLENGEMTFERFKAAITSVAEQNHDITDFNGICEERAEALLRCIHYTYISLRSQQDYKSRISRFLRIFRLQTGYLCDMLDTVNLTIRKNLGFYAESSVEILSLMNECGIDVSDVVLTSDFSGGLRAVIKAEIPLGDNVLKRDISAVLRQYTKREFLFSYSKEPSGNEKYLYVYEEEYERYLKAGFCSRPKEGEDVSGDSILIKDFSNMQICAICDGMGSGIDAGSLSRKVINMLDGLLSAGYEYQNVVELINSVLTFGGDTEIFTTLDMLLYDRSSSTAVFFKAGAESAYIKRGGEIIKIKSETLPIGILESTHAKAVTMPLYKGDYIYMFSDGLVSTFGYNEEYIRTIISDNTYHFPQKIADNILKTALDVTDGIAKDDISVIVCKVR